MGAYEQKNQSKDGVDILVRFLYSQLSHKRTPSGIEKSVYWTRTVRLQELFP